MKERPRVPAVACPNLPTVHRRLDADWTRSRRGQPADSVYLATLEYAQSLWLEEKPAQAILQLNKALAVDLEDGAEVLARWPLPYRALVWMLKHAPADRFLGNPVRHFQHLATRVNEPHRRRRSWRAWACFHLAEAILSAEDFPRDEQQIANEDLRIPDLLEVKKGLSESGISNEVLLVEELLCELRELH